MTPSTARSHAVPLRGLLLAVGILALVVRLVYWIDVHDHALFQEATGDSATYLSLADALERDGLTAPLDQPYRMAPLYPGLLFVTNALGAGPDGVRALQFLLGAATAALLALLGWRLGGVLPAVVSGVGAALYGPFVFFEGELLSISIAVFLVALAATLWGRPRGAVPAGLSLGLAALAQPGLLLLGGLGAGISLARPRASGWTGRRDALLLAVALLVPVTLTCTRNLVVSGEPILISTNGGINFFIGNNPDAPGTFHLPPRSGLVNRPEGLFTSAREVAESGSTSGLSDAAVDRYWWFLGLDFWATRFGDAATLYGRKLLLSLNQVEVPNHYDFGYFRSASTVLGLLPTMAVLLPFGLLGLFLARRRWATGVWGFVIVLGSVALFFVTGRYRLPLAVFLWPAAGFAVAHLWSLRGQRLRLVFPLAAVAAGALLAFLPLLGASPTTAHMKNLEGVTLFQQGDLDAAQRAFEEALAADPGHAEALNNLGKVLLQSDPRAALGYFQRALVADPTQAETYFNLEEMYRRSQRYAEANEILDRLEQARAGRVDDVAGMLAYRRGANALALQDTLLAEASFRTAVEEQPDLAGAWLSLSMLYRKLERPAESLSAAQQAATLVPQAPQVQSNLGHAAETAQDWPLAATAFVRLLDSGETDREIRFRAGRALLRSGQTEDAEAYLVAANEGAPHEEALWLLGELYLAQDRSQEARAAYSALVKVQGTRAEAARDKLRDMGPGSRDARN